MAYTPNPRTERVMIVTRIEGSTYGWWSITARARGWRATWQTRNRTHLLLHMAGWYGCVKLRYRNLK